MCYLNIDLSICIADVIGNRQVNLPVAVVDDEPRLPPPATPFSNNRSRIFEYLINNFSVVSHDSWLQ